MNRSLDLGTLGLLVDALRFVAAPAAVQREVLPPWVAVPDEVALAFEDARITYDLSTLPEGAVRSIMAIDDQIRALRLMDDAWTEDALERHTGWEELRALARGALVTLGSPYQAPQPMSGQYVQVKRRPRLVGRLVDWLLARKTKPGSSSDLDVDG